MTGETQKCVHKGCGRMFSDPNEECTYHAGPPIFHEGQKGWTCCKPRVLTFDEFLTIPPCTKGKHTTVDDTPAPPPKPTLSPPDLPPAVPRTAITDPRSNVPSPAPTPAPPPIDESDSDDPADEVPTGVTCKRRGCGKPHSKDGTCTFHPGYPVFHEGTKGWSCCKKRVLEFDEFLGLEGCKSKKGHLFRGKKEKEQEKDKGGIQNLDGVRMDFYQTTASVYASIYLKGINKEKSKVEFTSSTSVTVDLYAADGKHYAATIPLYGKILPEKSKVQIMGTKMELTLAKADASGWPVLKSTDPLTGEIIQSGRAGVA